MTGGWRTDRWQVRSNRRVGGLRAARRSSNSSARGTTARPGAALTCGRRSARARGRPRFLGEPFAQRRTVSPTRDGISHRVGSLPFCRRVPAHRTSARRVDRRGRPPPTAGTSPARPRRDAAANTGPIWRLITRWMAANLDQPALLAAHPHNGHAVLRRLGPDSASDAATPAPATASSMPTTTAPAAASTSDSSPPAARQQPPDPARVLRPLFPGPPRCRLPAGDRSTTALNDRSATVTANNLHAAPTATPSPP